ncbi:hypothetical protein CFAM422_004280 [Trichoderma lentiforme]|uniref:Uncharacterized protein n=1 Tax=Trichoderma lentiforme TaxID=1567552 RepID=A0A9P4XJU9_9HYPO|nr:hypothetical protein CFAM422_004280 [Trichoderma lentiforme]
MQHKLNRDIVLDSSPVHSFLRANSGNSLPPGTPSYLTEDALQTKQIRSPKADGNMLAIRVKTAEVQRIITPLPLLLAFLVASHITELEGVVSVIIGLLRREEITLGVMPPLKRAILRKEIVKSPRPLIEHRKRHTVSSAKQILRDGEAKEHWAQH